MTKSKKRRAVKKARKEIYADLGTKEYLLLSLYNSLMKAEEVRLKSIIKEYEDGRLLGSECLRQMLKV